VPRKNPARYGTSVQATNIAVFYSRDSGLVVCRARRRGDDVQQLGSE